MTVASHYCLVIVLAQMQDVTSAQWPRAQRSRNYSKIMLRLPAALQGIVGISIVFLCWTIIYLDKITSGFRGIDLNEMFVIRVQLRNRNVTKDVSKSLCIFVSSF